MKSNFMMYSCKEATLLLSMREEGKLGLLQRAKLRLHLSMCRFCTRFEKQSRFIARQFRHLPDQELKMPEEKKNAIAENFRG